MAELQWPLGFQPCVCVRACRRQRARRHTQLRACCLQCCCALCAAQASLSVPIVDIFLTASEGERLASLMTYRGGSGGG